MMQALKKNIGWKLGSLALSTLIWLALASDQPVATSVSAPLQYKNIPRELEMTSDVTERIHLEVRGPSGKLTPENLSDAAVVLDLASVGRPGQRTFLIREAGINLPSGVTLVRSIPDQVRLAFEKRVQRTVPVVIRVNAQPPHGYDILAESVQPKQISIVGPESNVRLVNNVETDPVDLSAVVGAATFAVQTYIRDPQVRFEGDGKVVVRIEVGRRR